MTRLVFAHGFTQTAASWLQIEELVAGSADECVAVDMPGHGSAVDVAADLWGSADHLVYQGGAATYVGYSMGGRVALHAALAHPDAVERLVLIGATPGITDTDERVARRAADERLAAHIEAVGVEQFIDEWLTNPLFAGLTAEAARRDERLGNTVSGLASSLRHCGTGTQEPLWERLGEIFCPVLLLVGEHDPKFRLIAERMHDALPDSELVVVANSGHSVHLEQPEATAAAIADFVR